MDVRHQGPQVLGFYVSVSVFKPDVIEPLSHHMWTKNDERITLTRTNRLPILAYVDPETYIILCGHSFCYVR